MTAETTPDLRRGLDRLPNIFASCLGMAWERCATPFIIDGQVYATNGRICIRVPAPEGWDVPNPDRIIDRAPEVFRGEYQPDPIALPAVEAKDCPHCDGARFRDVSPCPECDGGDVDEPCDCPKCDGVHACTNCDGRGNLPAGPCRNCMRSGVAGGVQGVEVAPGVWVAERYLMVLARHGARVYLPATPDVAAYGLAPDRYCPPIRFVAGDVEGRLMPMDARACEHDRDQAAREASANHYRGEC